MGNRKLVTCVKFHAKIPSHSGVIKKILQGPESVYTPAPRKEGLKGQVIRQNYSSGKVARNYKTLEKSASIEVRVNFYIDKT